MEAHPDIDCLFLNAGTQSVYDLSDPASFDLERFQSEVHVNYISLVALTHAFIPIFKKRETPTSIIL
jgi:short-subunit dehydrogenase involved in D-alanine esterification of teichoic acids